MARHALRALLCLLCFGLIPASAGTIGHLSPAPPPGVGHPDPLIHDCTTRGVYLVCRDRYEESYRVFDSLLASHPEHPAPHFLKAASYQSWMNTFRTNRYQRELETNVRLAVDKGQRLLAEKDDPWLRFYIGSSYGYQALNHFRKSSWINAYLNALNGVYHLEAALEKEPRLYDAYLGLGTYYYWRTAKSRFLRSVAIWMEDRRETALAQIEFVVEHGLYAAHEASYSLIVAYCDRGLYEKALQLMERIIEKKDSPNITDLYYKGRILAVFKRWPEVESLFRQVLDRLRSSGVAGDAFQVECHYWIARALLEQNRTEEAIPFIESAFNRSSGRDQSTEPEGYFESHSEIQELLLQLKEEVKETQARRVLSRSREKTVEMTNTRFSVS